VKSELSRATNNLGSGYRSAFQDLIHVRTLGAANALFQVSQTISESQDWTNFDKALVELASLLTLSRPASTGLDIDARIDSAIMAVPSVVIPPLGPVLLRSVGRRRLSRVREQYVLQYGHDDIARTLQAIEQAAANSDYLPDDMVHESDHLSRLAIQMNEAPANLVRHLMEALEQHPSDEWMRQLGIGSIPLPIDRPTFYGGDHVTDEVMRPLLTTIRTQLGNGYPPIKWERLISVLEVIVRLAHYLRDLPPSFMLSKESGGVGQNASEGDLQDRVFEAIRQEFGQKAIYEHQRIGGGRPDTGVMFEECRFPIEVKHEFSSIERDHIHEHYLAQADLYAACTDGVALLLILDLRASNSAAHTTRRRAAKRTMPEQVFSFSALGDNFWIDQLPPDPQITNAKPAVVIVGIFPGNRFRPSEATLYSRRPQKSQSQGEQ
jgi:hypothetical protein